MNDNTAAGVTGPGDDAAPPVPEEIREAARLAPDRDGKAPAGPSDTATPAGAPAGAETAPGRAPAPRT
ncbi:hypothetical protein [Streptomyces sp. NRRL WC-3549]|uniref:hypothetical protein n=1 Tax=Streptomyces sp. NRRL WC-3549 TaxID=1463925 RepID=UPI0004C6DC54|nr:hypothetical protein [Streptomyces sp. NRRL WC-3549]